MSDLRTKCIEAAAHRLYVSKWGPSMSGSKPTSQEFHAAANALDAVLDVLTEHVDEWESLYGSEYEEGRVRSIAGHLLVVLKDTE